MFAEYGTSAMLPRAVHPCCEQHVVNLPGCGRNGSDCEAEKHVVADVGWEKSVSVSELRCGREVG